MKVKGYMYPQMKKPLAGAGMLLLLPPRVSLVMVV
jgi:hypothetical protein